MTSLLRIEARESYGGYSAWIGVDGSDQAYGHLRIEPPVVLGEFITEKLADTHQVDLEHIATTAEASTFEVKIQKDSLDTPEVNRTILEEATRDVLDYVGRTATLSEFVNYWQK